MVGDRYTVDFGRHLLEQPFLWRQLIRRTDGALPRARVLGGWRVGMEIELPPACAGVRPRLAHVLLLIAAIIPPPWSEALVPRSGTGCHQTRSDHRQDTLRCLCVTGSVCGES